MMEEIKSQSIEYFYKKWSLENDEEVFNAFSKNETWNGNMVKAFVIYCINEVNK